jgi:hypothetical protein
MSVMDILFVLLGLCAFAGLGGLLWAIDRI